MTHEAPGDPDESCAFFSCSGCYFLGGDKGVNCEPIHDYNYGYSFNFLLPVCKQDSTQPTKQRPPQKGIKPKISISTNTFPLYFLPFLLLNTTSDLVKYTSKTRYGSAKQTSTKTTVFAKEVHGKPTHPGGNPPTAGTDGTSPKTAFTAASPAAATALGPVMTSGAVAVRQKKSNLTEIDHHQ